jgi:hypothetical protein
MMAPIGSAGCLTGRPDLWFERYSEGWTPST